MKYFRQESSNIKQALEFLHERPLLVTHVLAIKLLEGVNALPRDEAV